MFIKFISYIPAIVGLSLVGVFVLLNNHKNIKNKVFAALNFVAIGWLLSLFVGDTTKSNTVALFSLRSGLFFSAFMFLFFYYFSLAFPFKSKMNKIRQMIYTLPLIGIAITSFTPLQVSSVIIRDFGVQPERVGALYSLSDFLGIGYLLAGIFIMLFKYRRSDQSEKNQIKSVLFGLSIVIIANIFTGIVLTSLKIDTDFILFGSFSLFIFSLFVAYSITRHGFLDVRLIVAKTAGYVLSLGAIVGIYSVLVFGLIAQFVDPAKAGAAQQFVYVVLAVVTALTFPPIKRFFDKLSNKLFYQDAYEPQELLNELNNLLVSQIELNKILKDGAQIIQKYLKVYFVQFYVGATDNTEAKLVATGELDNKAIQSAISGAQEHKTEKLLIVDDLPEEHSALRRQLLDQNVAAIVRLKSTSQQGREIGYLVLGIKRSGSVYNKQDIRIVNILADELVIAIQNALRFEEIQNFAATLQEKVNEATKQLRRANEKLKALDETKDEFISMASHQLRTPLTSVKGYVSMVLEGDAGKISETQRKLLDQSFLSAQRMVYLIADLLNVSRLRTGKFVIDANPTNLADVVEGEIQQLVQTAKSRNLELTYNKPKSFPALMLDETKIRQVIMNFADNAIYYTPSGGHIQVNLVDNPESVELTIVDDGIGVPKAEQHYLFNKFYRAGNAKKARPDGTGLGLFMAKKVIVAQGGAIIFKTEEGKGSSFGFSFPKDKLKVPAHIKPAEKAASSSTEKAEKPKEPKLL